MPSLFLQGLVAAAFVTYPSAGDKGIVTPRALERSLRVEAVIDRGPILEVVIRCSSGAAIMFYSKVERLYCTPKHVCNRSLAQAMAQTCR